MPSYAAVPVGAILTAVDASGTTTLDDRGRDSNGLFSDVVQLLCGYGSEPVRALPAEGLAAWIASGARTMPMNWPMPSAGHDRAIR